MGKAIYYVLAEEGEQEDWHCPCSGGAYSLMVNRGKQTPIIKWDKFCDERYGDCHRTKQQRSRIVRRSKFPGRNDAMLRPEEQVRANQKEKWGRKAVFQAEE